MHTMMQEIRGRIVWAIIGFIALGQALETLLVQYSLDLLGTNKILFITEEWITGVFDISIWSTIGLLVIGIVFLALALYAPIDERLISKGTQK